MKYFPLTLLAFFFLLIFTNGLNEAKAQAVDFGIKGGLNISSHLDHFLYEEDDIDLDLKPDIAMGFNVGLLVRKHLLRNLRIQTEPSLIMLGAKYDDTFSLRGSEFETDSRTDLLYIHLPLLLQLTTAPKQRITYGRKRSKTTFHLSSGLYGGYLLDAKFKGSNSGAPIGIEFEGEFSNDVTSNYKEYDAGGLLGVGFEHGHYSKLGFEVRALVSVIDSGDNPEISSFKHQNMALTFSLYWIF